MHARPTMQKKIPSKINPFAIGRRTRNLSRLDLQNLMQYILNVTCLTVYTAAAISIHLTSIIDEYKY